MNTPTASIRCNAETLETLERRGVDVRIDETNAAAELYNQLAARGESVGGLFHSTC